MSLTEGGIAVSNRKTPLMLFALAGDAFALQRADLVGAQRDRSERSSQAPGSVADATAGASSRESAT